MKKLILVSIAMLLVFTVVPAIAGEKSSLSSEPAVFQALSNLSVPGQMALNTMSDEQLAAIEGQGRWGRRFQKNNSFIYQENKCVACAFVYQSNSAFVSQSNH
jgi:hypothetical protein